MSVHRVPSNKSLRENLHFTDQDCLDVMKRTNAIANIDINKVPKNSIGTKDILKHQSKHC